LEKCIVLNVSGLHIALGEAIISSNLMTKTYFGCWISGINRGSISFNLFWWFNLLLSDRVLLKPMEAEQKTAGGIIIPDNAKEKPQKGEIVAVGPGKMNDKGQRIEMTLKKGDKVLYGKYSGTEITVDGEDYLILRESDVLAVI
jgi:chaperonin GroES